MQVLVEGNRYITWIAIFMAMRYRDSNLSSRCRHEYSFYKSRQRTMQKIKLTQWHVLNHERWDCGFRSFNCHLAAVCIFLYFLFHQPDYPNICICIEVFFSIIYPHYLSQFILCLGFQRFWKTDLLYAQKPDWNIFYRGECTNRRKKRTHTTHKIMFLKSLH